MISHCGGLRNIFNPTAAKDGFDWYGNSRLHQLCASADKQSQTCFRQVQLLVRQFPDALFLQNQFGRLPLHYALDRLSGKLCIDIIRFLITSFPEAVTIRDNFGKTCLQISRSWDHPNNILCYKSY